MRNNQPVTRNEYVLREGAAIISRTDTKGRIVDCNQEFIEASGFTREELLGQAHNLVRHPDMPEEAFRDFWDTLKRGRPWSGLVKNRRKNGDYYWVRATATPLADGSGYSSVRTKPSRQEIEEAETLYRRMRNDEAIRLFEGAVASTGMLSALGRSLGSLTIAARLWLMALALVVLMLGSAGLGAYVMHRATLSAQAMSEGKDLVADILPPPLYLTEAHRVAKHVLLSEGDERAAEIAQLTALKQQYDARYRHWHDSALPPEVKQSLAGEQHQHADAWWRLALERLLPSLQAKDAAGAEAAMEAMDREFASHQAGILDTIGAVSDYTRAQEADMAQERRQSLRWLLGMAGGGLVLTLLIVSGILRHIRRRLHVADEVISAISGGNLTQHIPAVGQDEVGALVVKMAIMRNSLHELIAAIRQNVDALTGASQSLTRNARIGAETSNAQSEAAASMAAAVEELSVSVDMVESNAGEAHAISRNSAERSTEGGAIIHEAAGEMERIATSVHSTAESIRELEVCSHQISTIVDVIRDIADQTNLLALNAAIEAARAGEYGRGFAVVSDEVRKLAERTNRATLEIVDMIAKIQGGTERAATEMEAGVSRVKEGVRLARQAGDSMAGIRDGSDQVTHAVKEISYALKEQGTAARDIAQKVEQIAQSAEANSHSSAQTALSAEQLLQLSKALEALASRFRIA